MIYGKIYIQNLRQHAFHGVLPQERIVGNDFIVNVSVDYPLQTACQTDNVDDTLNYAILADIIREQMAIQSNLIEHVAARIADCIMRKFKEAQAVDVDIRKIAPPMQIDADGAGVRIRVTRDN